MALTAEEKVRTRAHLGYLNVAEAYTFVFGIPAAVQTQFSVEGAMLRILVDAEPQFRATLAKLDTIEAQMMDDLELLAVERVGEIGISEKEHQKLRREYLHWRAALANMMGIIPNPFDQRFAGNNAGVNVPVQG